MTDYFKTFIILFTVAILVGFSLSKKGEQNSPKGKWLLLNAEDISDNPYNLDHLKNYGKYTEGNNLEVLRAIDSVQSHAMNGGGYFIGKDSTPTESPIGYNLRLFNHSLINPPRTTSYCSGSSYSVLITALNFILPDGSEKISDNRMEAMRMQELDGGRREDWIKYWGIWNADGFGSEYALVQYADMGKVVKPEDARPGDFMNISWKTGIGHSVIFLGWYVDKDGNKNIVYWSSQKATNGMSDQIVPLSRIKDVKIVRLTNPENVFKFDVEQKINKDVPGDPINL